LFLRSLAFAMLFLAPLVTSAQATRWDWNALTANTSAPQPGSLLPLLAIPNAPVSICTYQTSGTSCNVLATTYTDSSAGTPCNSATQLTRPSGSTCYADTDETGGMGAWLTPGNYSYFITTFYGTFGPYAFSVDAGGAYLSLAGGTITGKLAVGTSCPSGLSTALCSKIINSVYYARAYTSGGLGTLLSPWTSASGTGGCQEAVNAAAANGGGRVVFEDGYYSVTNVNGCAPADNTWWEFSRNAVLLAGANNVTVVKQTVHAFNAILTNPYIDGNGFTGVTAIDVTNFRFGAAIVNPLIINTGGTNANGIILRSSFDIPVINPSISSTALPITVTAFSGGVKILNPNIDGEIGTACTDGITINSTGGAVIGTIVDGGYVQGCTDVGILDSAIGTKVKDTYFEANTNADIYENAATDPYISGTQHFAGVGAVAIKGRNTTGARIEVPLMGNTARSTGLYDWDGTNTNSYEFHIVDAGSKNLPEGTVTGLQTFATIPSPGHFGSFIAGTITGEAGTDVNIQGGAAAVCDFGVKDPTGLTNRLAICEPATGSSVDGGQFYTKGGFKADVSIAQGSGLKHQRFGATCTTTTSCTTTYTWTTPFTDANYTPVCWGVNPTGFPILILNAVQIAAGITVNVESATGANSGFAGVYCEAMHD